MRISVSAAIVLLPLMIAGCQGELDREKLFAYGRIMPIGYHNICNTGDSRTFSDQSCATTIEGDQLVVWYEGDETRKVYIKETDLCVFESTFVKYVDDGDDITRGPLRVNFNDLFMSEINVWRAQNPRFKGIDIPGVPGAVTEVISGRSNSYDRLQITGLQNKDDQVLTARIGTFREKYCGGQ